MTIDLNTIQTVRVVAARHILPRTVAGGKKGYRLCQGQRSA